MADRSKPADLANSGLFYNSPIGPARYPHVEKPDTEFGKPGIFHLGVAVLEEDLAAFEKTCRELFARTYPGVAGPLVLPIKRDKAARAFIRGKSAFAPKISASGRINHDDLIRLDGRLRPYRTAERQGVSLTVHAIHAA